MVQGSGFRVPRNCKGIILHGGFGGDLPFFRMHHARMPPYANTNEFRGFHTVIRMIISGLQKMPFFCKQISGIILPGDCTVVLHGGENLPFFCMRHASIPPYA